MDYHSVHGHDVASFDITSSHRLPTVSASAALDELADDVCANIPTGLTALDKALAANSPVRAHSDESSPGGVTRGQVTELWGPPGAGKTALGVQLAAHSLSDGKSVVWVDCFQSLASQRLTDVLQAVSRTKEHGSELPLGEEGSAKFIHYNCLTLPHLIALISRPTAKNFPQATALVVLSSMTALVNSALPKSHDEQRGAKRTIGPGPSAKRRQALQSIMKALQTMALARNCAVLLLSQCATRMQAERQPALTPSINANVWEQGISTRIVVFKDWISQQRKLATICLASIQKLDGRAASEALEHLSAFTVENHGLCEVAFDAYQLRTEAAGHRMRMKRKLNQTDLEIPDSEDDEDYGWAEEDEASMPAPPQQWQGSEDILLGQEVGHSDEGEDGSDEHEREDI